MIYRARFALPSGRGRHGRIWLGQFFEMVEPADEEDSEFESSS